MTPKQKAKELVDKFESISGLQRFSKHYALICVKDKITDIKHMDKKWHDSEYNPLVSFFDYEIEYLEEVKKEIKNH